MLAAQPQATWIRDSGEWRLLVPPELAMAGERVVVARRDGSCRRVVVIGAVTERLWRGSIICTVDHGRVGLSIPS